MAKKCPSLVREGRKNEKGEIAVQMICSHPSNRGKLCGLESETAGAKSAGTKSSAMSTHSFAKPAWQSCEVFLMGRHETPAPVVEHVVHEMEASFNVDEIRGLSEVDESFFAETPAS